MRTYFSFCLILRDIPNSITPQTTLRLLPIPVGLLILPCTRQCKRSPLTPPIPPFFLSWTEEPADRLNCAKFPSLKCAHISLTGHSKFQTLPATDSGWIARTPLYPPVQAVPPYSLPPPAFFPLPDRATGEDQYLCP